MDKLTLNEICAKFNITNPVVPYGNGHVNDTYFVKSETDFILQRINTAIFKDAESLMKNIVLVTEHVGKKILEAGGNPLRETLSLVETFDHKSYYRTPDGDCYRMYRFISNSKAYQYAPSMAVFENAGKAFGRFQNMLADFPVHKLTETIPDFHCTPKRLENLKRAVANDRAGRKKDVGREIEFALSYEPVISKIVDGIASGAVPVRVTHNDTKLNNVLFDETTDEAICVIDLDTVMPGSMLYDYGDAMRFGTNTAEEDEADLSKVSCDLKLFEAYTRGYMSELGGVITDTEAELMPFSALLMTYECGIRFLEDHLNGDTYFKISRENHNIDRARNQLQLVADMECKSDEMMKIVKKFR